MYSNKAKIGSYLIGYWFVCLFVFDVPSTARSFRELGHPHLLSLAKDVKLNKYTVPTRNRTPGRRMAVHYATAAPHKLLGYWKSHIYYSTNFFEI